MRHPIYLRGDYWFMDPPSYQCQPSYYPYLKLSINHVDNARIYNGRWSVDYLGTNGNILVAGQPPEVGIDQSIKIYIRSTEIEITDYASIQLKVHMRILHSRNSTSSTNTCDIIADLCRLFNSIERTADVEIVTGTSLSIRCHKAIICLRSPVFAAMFSHNMFESTTNRVIIEDFEQNIIGMFVEYLYKDAFNDADSIPSEDLKALVVIADKYQVSGLKDAAAAQLSTRLTSDNVQEMSNFAAIYDSKILMNVCLLSHTSD